MAHPHHIQVSGKSHKRLNPAPYHAPYLFFGASEQVQIGVLTTTRRFHRAVRCDVCSSAPWGVRGGYQPRKLYRCLSCGVDRFLCEPCAREMITNSSDFHTADHQLKLYLFDLPFDVNKTLAAPSVNVFEDRLAREDVVTDLLTSGLFHPPRYEGSRSISCFLRASPGKYFVTVRLNVLSKPSEHPDVLQKVFGAVRASSQKFGFVKICGRSVTLTNFEAPPSRKLRSSNSTKWVIQPIQWSESHEISLDIKLGLANILSPNNSLEVLFQDHYDPSRCQTTRPFSWKIKQITCAHPSYPTLARNELTDLISLQPSPPLPTTPPRNQRPTAQSLPRRRGAKSPRTSRPHEPGQRTPRVPGVPTQETRSTTAAWNPHARSSRSVMARPCCVATFLSPGPSATETALFARRVAPCAQSECWRAESVFVPAGERGGGW